MRRLLLPLLLLLAVAACGRETIALSGEWDFKTDPKEVGIAEAWFDPKIPFDCKITVPGSWNAQGVGEPSDKLFSGYPGPAWYRKTVTIPVNWQGKVIRLKFGGVHRYADVWINGRRLGEHIGYLTPFEYDISGIVTPGKKAVIVVRVDARQRTDIDPLIGCFDIIDGMMQKLLSLEAKLPGRFSICGFVHRDTNLRNLEICYAAARKYGEITAR